MVKFLKNGFATLFIFILAFNVNANDINTKILTMTKKPTVIAQGKTLFEQVCASCHSKDLSGASGFNLKDGEWVHGNKPSQIMTNIKRGFMNAGMPAFKGVFSEEKLQSIVAYVLSKREGFDGLTYKIYQMDDASDKALSTQKIIKTGTLSSNLPDFQLPEIKYYTIIFEGDFYAPKDKETKIWAEWGFHLDLDFFVNGNLVKRGGERWYPTWKLNKGKQHLKLIYRAGTNKPNMRNISLIVTNPDLTIKLFPLSVRAKLALADNKIEIKAEQKAIVLRKKIHKLPAFSISVGLPSQINYAFNTRSCSIVGLWEGDLLNIGPNVSGRGEQPSLPIGDWVFHYPHSLELSKRSNSKCHYKGYEYTQSGPAFTYTQENKTFTLMVETPSSDEIQFNYQVTGSTNKNFQFTLPTTNSVKWTTPNGTVNSNTISVTPNSSGSFSINAKFIK